jgi:DNA-binding MarR family transcriptional regulator
MTSEDTGRASGSTVRSEDTASDNSAPFPGWRQTRTLDLLRELATVAAEVRPTVARRARLSESELVALEHLMGGALGPVEVGRRLGVTSAASTGIVDRLEARGHVHRAPHPVDRRRTEVSITESGRSEVLGYLMPMFRSLAQLDAELSEAEREVVDRYLAKAIASFRAVLDEPDSARP